MAVTSPTKNGRAAAVSSSSAAVVAPTTTVTHAEDEDVDDPANIPKTMAECLDCPDPVAALLLISQRSHRRAVTLSSKLQTELLADISQVDIPDILADKMTQSVTGGEDHAVINAEACADSILHSLTKIATGGSQASHEIRQLESEKRAIECEANAVATALMLRKNSDQAAHAIQSRDYMGAAHALRPWLDWKTETSRLVTTSATATAKQQPRKDNTATTTTTSDAKENDDGDQEEATAEEEAQRECEIARAYAGEYALTQLQASYQQLKQTLLTQYESAVKGSDVQTLGNLTPVLSHLQLEEEALGQYLTFLRGVLTTSLQEQQQQQQQTTDPNKPPPPSFVGMAKIYNQAVVILRHHLPMISHCLHKAKGDVAVVQLVHVQVEEAVLPLLEKYSRQRQLPEVAQHAQRIYSALEDRYAGGGQHAAGLTDQLASGASAFVESADGGGTGAEADDCGFAVQIGSLSDTAQAMEETALTVQHAESYLRFIQHTCQQVNQAHRLRFDQEQERLRLERERKEWTAGTPTGSSSSPSDEGGARKQEAVYKEIQVLPPFTNLHQQITELGGQYASIEHCLLLASMQRAFTAPDNDPRYYRPLTIGGMGSNSTAGGMSGGAGSGQSAGGSCGTAALQTALVETCLYAARCATQRAMATGHTGTASAMTNFTVDCLHNVLLEVMRNRAETLGVAPLKPGEGLIVGSAAIFNTASHLIRQGTNVSTQMMSPTHGHGHGGGDKDELSKRKKVLESIAFACATINDLEVACFHIEQLEGLLMVAIDKGFPPDQHETEQLRMCAKSLQPVRDSFRLAADGAVESLESVLKPRLRSIVTDAIGSDAAGSAAGFMGHSVVMGGKTESQNLIRMNYDLDEDAYNMQQLAEGYVARLCTLLDELLEPLRLHLAPRLWDKLLLNVLGSVSKRLEQSLRKCRFTALGALTLDSDMRDLLSYTKDRLHSENYASNIALQRACLHLARLLQVARLLSVDDLDDVLDLISSSKRKGQWDLGLQDAKAFLSARVEFQPAKVNELLRLPDDD